MKRLRSGYTTGACAAAAAKAAATMLISDQAQGEVTIPFPDGTRVSFQLCACHWSDPDRTTAHAAVIKDAGDDPDVTNGAQIEAAVRFATDEEIRREQRNEQASETKQDLRIIIAGGQGIGTVTKRGLAIPVGEPAINPVPRTMIREAVTEALSLSAMGIRQSLVVAAPAIPGSHGIRPGKRSEAKTPALVVTISIPNGVELAEKTLNHRLGIIGGLSILGTTGIVRPISADAWTATISASMDVARAAGVEAIVLSTGRTSELAVQQQLLLPEEAHVMMGDYLHYALVDAGKHGFAAIHLAAMWAKVMKGAMRIPQTHVRNGALEIENAISFLATLGTPPAILKALAGSNTAREIYERLIAMGAHDIVTKVCTAARDYCQEVSGLPVTVYLVHIGQARPGVAGAKDGAGATSSRQIVASVPGNL